MLRPDNGAEVCRLFGGANQPVHTDLAGLRRALGGKFPHRAIIAGAGQIVVVVGGQHRDGEDAQAVGARVDRGFHGLRVGMHGEKGRTNAAPGF